MTLKRKKRNRQENGGWRERRKEQEQRKDSEKGKKAGREKGMEKGERCEGGDVVQGQVTKAYGVGS